MSGRAPAVSSKKSLPRKESKKSVTKPTEDQSARLDNLVISLNISIIYIYLSLSSSNVVKTTMTVRLHPGNLEDQLQKEEEEEEVVEVEEVVEEVDEVVEVVDEVEEPTEEDTGELTPLLNLAWSDKHAVILSSPNTGTLRARSVNLVTI